MTTPFPAARPSALSEACGWNYRASGYKRGLTAESLRACAGRRRQAVLEQKILGEDLARFEARRRGIRAKNRQPGFLETIHYTGAKRRFRT